MTDSFPFGALVAWLAVGTYVAGSIPFGFLLGRLKGLDLREHGSRNIGATNAGRVLGRKYFLLVLLLDAAKGFVPTLISGHLLFRYRSDQWFFLAWVFVACLAIVGHNWPCWLKFKGGKGVATSLGVVLAIYPYFTFPGLIAFLVWILLVKVTGYVSVGSIAAAAAFLAGYALLVMLVPTWSFRDQWVLLVFSTIMVAVLIARHRSNLQRLRSGMENKFTLSMDHDARQGPQHPPVQP